MHSEVKALSERAELTPNEDQFPIDALPEKLRRFVIETAESLPVAVDLVAIPALVAISAAIGNSRVINLKPGWSETASLFAAIVSPVGALKTPASKAALGPIFHHQENFNTIFSAEMTAYEKDLALYEKHREDGRKSKRVDCPIKPEAPKMKRAWTADVTVERLASLLSENPRGILLARDELSGWAASLNQYKSGRGADRQFFLSAWSGVPLAVDRQSRPPILLNRPTLSVFGCIPPEIIAHLGNDNDTDDGLVGRFLFAFPKSIPTRWIEKSVSVEARNDYCNIIAKLYELESSEDKPMSLTLTPDARSLLIHWHDSHCQEAEGDNISSVLKGFYSKLKGYATRLALIHQLVTDPTAKVVSRDSVGAALDLTDYFKQQSKKIIPLLTRSSQAPHDCCEKEILRHLSDGNKKSTREIQRAGNSSAVVFNRVLDGLIKVGRVTIKIQKSKRGRPQKFVQLIQEK